MKNSSKKKHSVLTWVFLVITILLLLYTIYTCINSILSLQDYAKQYQTSLSTMKGQAVQYIIQQTLPNLVYTVILFGITVLLDIMQSFVRMAENSNPVEDYDPVFSAEPEEIDVEITKVSAQEATEKNSEEETSETNQDEENTNSLNEDESDTDNAEETADIAKEDESETDNKDEKSNREKDN